MSEPSARRVERVIEKPTPTEAEQMLAVPGLRAGHYLCLFGVHAFAPCLFDLLERQLAGTDRASEMSATLTALAESTEYLALEAQGWRYDVGVRYGLLNAQLALALSGVDRNEVLSQLLELLAQRHMRGEGQRS